MQVIVEWFTTHLGAYITPQLLVFFISMLPILELRGGILAASLLKVPSIAAIPICVLGNIVPIPFVLLFINKILNWLKKTKHLSRFAYFLEDRALKKSDSIKKYEFWGLVLFVGIPLPGTGAWTGSLVAALLHIDIKKASLAILLGILVATVIMYIVSYGIVANIVH